MLISKRAIVIVSAMVLGVGGSTAKAATGARSGSEVATPKAKVKVGSMVAAPWGSGFYLGEVKAVEGKKVKVLYDDDKQVREVDLSAIRPIKVRAWKVGDKVKAVWSAGRFYDGKITAAKGATYTIAWADGSSPSDVSATKIIEP